MVVVVVVIVAVVIVIVIVIANTQTQEFLERKFYQECLTKFNVQDFFNAGFHPSFFKQLHQIAFDEQTHVDFLSGAIIAAGGKPVNEATYNFPLTDARSCVTLASVLEGVGVSA